MKRIFISSNYASINELYHLTEETLPLLISNEKGFNKLGDNKIIYFDNKEKNFLIANNNSQIILIQDNINSDDFEIMNINKINDFLLYHKETEDYCKENNSNLFGLFNANQIQKGHHMAQNEYYYEPVFRIILNDGLNIEDKVNEILKILYPPKKDILETKLTLLHHCLVPDYLNSVSWETDGTITLTDIDGKVNKLPAKLSEEAREKFEDLRKQKDGPFGPHYIAILKDLRDVLIPG